MTPSLFTMKEPYFSLRIDGLLELISTQAKARQHKIGPHKVAKDRRTHDAQLLPNHSVPLFTAAAKIPKQMRIMIPLPIIKTDSLKTAWAQRPEEGKPETREVIETFFPPAPATSIARGLTSSGSINRPLQQIPRRNAGGFRETLTIPLAVRVS
jgi:hypothetical protein